MKLLHAVLSQGFFGSERYCIELALAQARAGHQVAIVVEGRHSDCARYFIRDIAASREEMGRRSPVRLFVIPRRLPAWLHRPLARSWLAGWRPDIVHTHLNPAARRVGGPAKGLGIPHVATLHLDFDEREHAGCDGLIALTRTQRDQVASRFYGRPLAAIWNWMPTSVLAAMERATPSEITNLRRAWDADDGTVVFGSVGRLHPAKGMDRLIEAFRAAFPGDAAVRLVLVGAGEQRPLLDQLIGGDPRIVLAGHRSDIGLCYKAFDIFVSAARSEPFGLAIVEAMAAARPLICSRVSGPAEFATDERIRWVEPDDQNTLVAALQTAFEDGRRSTDYDMAPFSVTRAAEEIEQFYRSVLAARPD